MAGSSVDSVNDLLSRIRTIGDAIDAINELFLTQMDRADTENADPNTAVEGDKTARDAFLTVLPILDQRILFLRLIRNRRFLPRIRTLVGSPPFSFLQARDDDVLRAAGITRGRTHMATLSGDISSYSSFGSAQFLDSSGRDFKIVGRALTQAGMASLQTLEARRETLLPFVGLNTGDAVVAEVRLKKRSLAKKVEIASGRGDLPREAVVFPRAGSVVNLEPSKRLRTVSGSIVLNVNAVQPRGTDANVARVIARVG